MAYTVTQAIAAFLSDLVLNVSGGFLAAVVFALSVAGLRVLQHHVIKKHARQLFGKDALTGAHHLVFSEFEPRPDNLPDFPFRKPGEAGFAMRTSRVLPLCDARAIGYVASVFGSFSDKTAPVTSDMSVQHKLDLSFVSFGLGSNYKTRQLMSNDANVLFEFDFESNALCLGGEGVKPRAGYDYGVIAKIRPKQFPNRVWIACAGLGEWGTSAAAWYLANKWRALHARAGDKQFVALVQVRPEQDESPQLVLFYK